MAYKLVLLTTSLPQTSSSPLKIGRNLQRKGSSSNPSIFRGDLLVAGRVLSGGPSSKKGTPRLVGKQLAHFPRCPISQSSNAPGRIAESSFWGRKNDGKKYGILVQGGSFFGFYILSQPPISGTIKNPLAEGWWYLKVVECIDLDTVDGSEIRQTHQLIWYISHYLQSFTISPAKCMAILRDFPYNRALLGLSENDPCDFAKFVCVERYENRFHEWNFR